MIIMLNTIQLFFFFFFFLYEMSVIKYLLIFIRNYKLDKINIFLSNIIYYIHNDKLRLIQLLIIGP